MNEYGYSPSPLPLWPVNEKKKNPCYKCILLILSETYIGGGGHLCASAHLRTPE